jgi:hypothetical protein
MVNGRSHHAAAPPAILWPDSMGDWLTCTLDANCQDEYVIAQAAQLGKTPKRPFAFVRDLGFESYSGSLRGARGTLWSAAGNSVDQASLLIALLRASGVPARYRSGELANGDIETLILSMFPAPLGVVGYLPDDNPFPLADPLQNQPCGRKPRPLLGRSLSARPRLDRSGPRFCRRRNRRPLRQPRLTRRPCRNCRPTCATASICASRWKNTTL